MFISLEGRATMAHYVGLDVSLEETSICVIDEAGDKVWQEVSNYRPVMAQKMGEDRPLPGLFPPRCES